MALNITTQVTNTTLKQNVSPLTIDEITVVITFRDGEGKNYFGGQVVLSSDGDKVTFNTTTEEIQTLAIAKAKDLLAASSLPVVEPVPDEPVGVTVDSNEDSATISAN